MANNIPQQVLKNLGQIVEETGKEIGKNVIKVTDSVITGKDLLGNIKPLSEQELIKKKQDDERKKMEEIAKLTKRNIEGEMKEVRQEEQQKENEEEKMLLQIKQQREAEEAERQQLAASMGVSANPEKRKKKRGGAFVQGKKKTQQPDPASMSATSEFKGKVD